MMKEINTKKTIKIQTTVVDFDIEVYPENAEFVVPDWVNDNELREYMVGLTPDSKLDIDRLKEDIALDIAEETEVDEPNGDFEVAVTNVELGPIIYTIKYRKTKV